MTAELAILVPVLNRPHRVEPLLQSIAEATDVQYRVVFACSDQATVDELDRMGAEYLRDDGDTWPNRINRLFHFTTEPYFFCGADDLDFRPGWFQAAMRVMEPLDGVVAVNDLLNSAGVHFLISRNYINTMSGCIDIPDVVACPQYQHAYSDDEIRAVAISRGKFDWAQDAIVEHMHPGVGKAPTDETYQIGEASMSQGRDVFLSRGHLWATPIGEFHGK